MLFLFESSFPHFVVLAVCPCAAFRRPTTISQMASTKLQARLASDILGCGRKRVWIDPNESADIAQANSRKAVRKLIKEGLIIRKPVAVQTRSRWRVRKEALQMGRHMGPGKREGAKNSRMPSKTIWMTRLRVLRRLLRKYREEKKIDRQLYRSLYQKTKGNVFKNKRNLMEYIHRVKNEKKKEKQLADQLAAKASKDAAMRAKSRKDELKKREKERVKAQKAAAEATAAAKKAAAGKAGAGKKAAAPAAKAPTKAPAKAAPAKPKKK